jgi:hypothetical protein
VPFCINVNSDTPASIGSITGPVNGVCGESNVNYSVGVGANSYVWTLPSGATGSSSTNSINVNFGGGFTSGNITVTGNFACGSSSTSIFVTGAPGVPSVPSGGVSSLCVTDINQVYSVNATGANGYVWTAVNADGIADCQNPPLCSQYTVEAWVPGASLSVTASNSCGTSDPFVFPVGCRVMMMGDVQTSIFPNPTSGKVTIEFSSETSQQFNISVTDISGRSVLAKDIKAAAGMNSSVIDLTEMGAGLYLVYIKDANGNSSVTKVAVE